MLKSGPFSGPKLARGGRGPPLKYHIVVTVSSVELCTVPSIASVIFSSCVNTGPLVKLSSSDESL